MREQFFPLSDRIYAGCCSLKERKGGFALGVYVALGFDVNYSENGAIKEVLDL